MTGYLAADYCFSQKFHCSVLQSNELQISFWRTHQKFNVCFASTAARVGVDLFSWLAARCLMQRGGPGFVPEFGDRYITVKGEGTIRHTDMHVISINHAARQNLVGQWVLQ
jgi:hypothetical protein